MKLAAALPVLAGTAVLAAPTRRAALSVYLCTERDFAGSCVRIPSAASECVALAADLEDVVSAARPEQGSFCYFFVNPGCDISGDFFHVGYPGYADLSKTPVNGPEGSTRDFEDKLSSYFCVDE